ncbi:MAG: S4 domain-containing protein, partial [Candidatus Omnitrophica bacterium]|nr:S4 domain-containing protein [Candidatus Omnitrophota bacterium]
GFEKVFSQHQIPDEMAEYSLMKEGRVGIIEILLKKGLVESKSEARRLLKQGGIAHDGQKIESESWSVVEGVIKIGKRRFLKITA